MDIWIKRFLFIDISIFLFFIPFVLVYGYLDSMYAAEAVRVAEIEAKAKRIVRTQDTQTDLVEIGRKKQAVQKVPSTRPVTSAEAKAALEKIARCESGNDPLAKNPISSAKGLLQIIDGTWQSFGCVGDVFDPEDNMSCGIKIATQSGLHHWNPSRPCWSRLVKI